MRYIAILLLIFLGVQATASNAVKKRDNAYPYGFNGKMKDNEYAGVGNHLDFGARGYDPRTGKWPTPDKMQDEYPSISPYAFCINSPISLLDPDGNNVHVYISDKPVGTTQIRLIQPAGLNGIPATVAVPLYEMTVTSDASKTVSRYTVTRDGPVYNSVTKSTWWKFWEDDQLNIDNTAFEPKKDNAKFVLVPLAYPKGMEAFALRNPDGSANLDAESSSSTFRKKSPDIATGVMIHVGGMYKLPGVDIGDNDYHRTGSEGCFTLGGADAGNQGLKRFMDDIKNRQRQDELAKMGRHVDLNLKKRKGVETKYKYNLDMYKH